MDQFRPNHFSQLKHMAVFALVVDLGSFTKAAARLDLAKSAVSRYVTELEEELGVVLLRRTTRKLHLTEEGERFFAQCSRFVDAAIDTIDSVEPEAQLRGTLHLTATHSYARYVLVPAVQSFSRLHPDLKMRISAHDRFVDLIEQGIDLAIRGGSPGSSPGYIAKKIHTMRYRLYASPKLLQCQTIRRPTDLEKHPWVIYEGGITPDRWTLSKGKKVWNITVPSQFSSDSGEVLFEAGRAGMGIIGVPDFMCKKRILGNLQPILPDFQVEPEVGFYAVYPQRRFLSPRVSAFMKHLETERPFDT